MKTQCCCETNHTLHVKAMCCSDCKETCGAKVNSSPDHQGNGTPAPLDNRCREPYDVARQLCCGKHTIINKTSSDYKCCGDKEYNTKTHCCCEQNYTLHIKPISSSAYKGVQQRKPRSLPNCTVPHTAVCGSTCYNPNLLDCCVRNNTEPNCDASGHCGDATPTVFNPRTHFCCYGHVTDRDPWIDEFPCSPDKHCCGGKVYNPETHICCNQQRWHEGEHIHYCGAEVYNISDPQMKCCAGTLYNLRSLNRSAHETKCCGSILVPQDDVCCLKGGKEFLYSAKKGFSCCRHLYYNTSLWSCSAGKLHPIKRQGHSSCKRCKN